MKKINVGSIAFSNTSPMSLISGTCAIENRDTTLKTAEKLKEICDKLGIGLVYKGSFDKANRTSDGARGLGLEEGLKILQEVKEQFGLPVLTDVHESHQVPAVAEVVDILQIPAFLCRQTDLLLACANGGKVVNIKKGQFLAPENMTGLVNKISATGNDNILLTERGTTFGYGNLVVDMRALQIMKDTNYPVIMDATHAVMMPGARGGSSGARRSFVEPLARAAAAVGIAGFFLEAHPNPTEAISDKESQIPLSEMEALLTNLKAIDEVAKAHPSIALKDME